MMGWERFRLEVADQLHRSFSNAVGINFVIRRSVSVSYKQNLTMSALCERTDIQRG